LCVNTPAIGVALAAFVAFLVSTKHVCCSFVVQCVLCTHLGADVGACSVVPSALGRRQE
jgi:hypothetical protein